MNPLSSVVLLKALDGLALRQDVIAQNIANADTPDYRPMRVTFEQALAKAARQGTAAVGNLKPQMAGQTGLEVGQPLRLDTELADSAATSGRYGSLVELLNRELQIDSMVISEGR